MELNALTVMIGVFVCEKHETQLKHTDTNLTR